MYRLRVLGGFALEGPSGGAAPPLPQRRAEAVLAVLAVCGDVGCTRERLLALLWPESDEARSRHGLRDALHFIRQALGAEAIRASGDLLRLDPAVVESDVHLFTQALRAEQRVEAVKLYGGPLLDGFHVDEAAEFERWLDGERTRLGRECGEALEQLAETAEVAGAWKEAGRWWARAVELDPLNSHLVLQQVRAMAAIGDRANAIKLADAHARRLRAELDLAPDREVLAKIERIRRGELPTPRVLRAGAARPGPLEHDARAAGEADAPSEAEAAPAASASAGEPAYLKGLNRWPPWVRQLAWVLLVGLVGAVGALTIGRSLRSPGTPRHPRTVIAVLPFQNLGADSVHAYIGGGLHDELLTQLAKVAALKVIGRTSVLGYEKTTKPLRQIGEELGVGSIVEGSVQIVGDRLRVTVQLLDPVTQTHLWAENYDRDLVDAFAVESDIAQRVVNAVGATLTREEVSAIAEAPTQSPEAYRFYLQGLEYYRRPGEDRQHLEIAQQLYERALALDSDFALAHAALSIVHGEMYSAMYDPSPARDVSQRREAEWALRLAPDLPQSHLAMGVLHHSHHDYQRALDEFRVALSGAPNSAEVWTWIALVHRRLAAWDSMAAAVEQAVRLDPRNAELIYGLQGYTLGWRRRYPEAIAVYRQALALAPDLLLAHLEIGWTYVKWMGDWDTLHAVLRSVPMEAAPDQALIVFLFDRQPDSVLALLKRPARVGELQRVYRSREMYAAWAYTLRGDSAGARNAFAAAAAVLDSEARARPQDWRVHGARGLAMARLGRVVDASREARWLEECDVYRKDRFAGVWAREARAAILVQLDSNATALAELERLLAGPGTTSVYTLRRDPMMDPIRSDPRFQALLRKYATPEPN